MYLQKVIRKKNSPRIRTTDLRIRILLFVSGCQDTKFFDYYFLKVPYIYNSLQRKKSRKETVEIKVFLNFFVDKGRIQIRTNNDEYGYGRPKNLQIRIHNTVVSTVYKKLSS
jgi:hypothetical protein